ncbi:hypothetical protein BD413DRAFT_301516 [Trametes elegans]|nr:hypothetical protein BD413DRAFT_301516 [Trametes elegans]
METVLIDDTNPRVQYQSGWTWEQGVSEVDGTRHGAARAGLTASLAFTGTGIQVIGTLGPSANYGQPKTVYTIDNEIVGSYDAPFSANTQFNVTFFAKRDLAPGDHDVRINNTDETNPLNTFWLDYFLVDTAPPASLFLPTTTSTTSTSSASSTTTALISTTTTSPLVTSSSSEITQTTFQRLQTGSSQLLSPPTPSATSQSAASSQSDRIFSSFTRTSLDSSYPVSLSTITDATGRESILTVSLTATPPTTTGVETASAAASPSTTGLSTGVIVGIVVAGLVVVSIIVVLSCCLIRQRRRRQADHDAASMSFSREQFASRNRSITAWVDAQAQVTHPFVTLPSTISLPLCPEGVHSFASTAAPAVAGHSSAVRTSHDLSATMGGVGLLTPLRRTSSPPTSPSSPSFSTSANVGAEPCVSDGPESSSTSRSDHTSKPSLSTRARRLSNTASLPALEAPLVPPGIWHAPPGTHSRAHSVLRAIFARGPRAGGLEELVQDVDSGLRLYDSAVLPPPYTQD